jgi:hypothetical protein
MPSPLKCFLPALLLAAGARAQAPQTYSAEWDMRAVLKEISAHGGRLVPVLDTYNPASWSDKEAAATYAAQWKSARDQAQALAGDAMELAQDPEKLPGALKCFFRMQSLEFMLHSLGDAVRRYQSPAAAVALAGAAAENGANRERFQRFIVELAARREQEYQIMDYEAQRCRASISRETPPARKPGRK